MKNSDWGAVAYLAISNYGEVTSSEGPSITLDGATRYTTTGNATGVLDFGKHRTVTSSLLETDDGTGSEYRTVLINNKETKYVEILSAELTSEKTKGQALAETYGWFGYSSNKYPESSAPIAIRYRYVGLGSSGTSNGLLYGSGVSGSNNTFRPVIWN